MAKTLDESGETKNRILKEAEKLFTLKGVKTTSLADIAKAAKISKGTLYYYYTLKEDMIYDITDNYLSLITKELAGWVSNIPETASKDDVLMTVIRRIVSAQTRGKLHLYLLSEAISDNERLKTRMMAKYKEWHNVIQHGIKAAALHSKFSPAALAQIIISLIDGFSILELMGIDNLAFEEASKILIQEV